MADRESLTQTLANLGLLSADDLGELQARQVIYGGDEQTCILELVPLKEKDLLSALSVHSGLPAAEEGPLRVELAASGRLLAQGKRAIFTIEADGQERVVVDRRPSDADKAEILGLFERAPNFAITSQLRLSEAIAYVEGGPVSSRQSALLSRMPSRLPQIAGNPDEVTAQAPRAVLIDRSPSPPPISRPPDSTAEVMKPMSVRLTALDEQLPQSGGETGPPPVDYEELAASPVAQNSKGPHQDRVPNHVYARADAEQDLTAAKTRDRVVELLVHFVAARFRYAATFGLHQSEARGLRASGSGASTPVVKGLTIPMDLPSCFRETQEQAAPRIVRLRASGLEGAIARDLKRPAGTEVLLVPITVKDKVVLLLWADNQGRAILPDVLSEVVSFAPLVSQALQRVLLEMKRKSRVAEPPQHSALPRKKTVRNPAAPPQPFVSPSSSRINRPFTASAPAQFTPDAIARPKTKSEPPPESPHEVALAQKRPLQRRSRPPGPQGSQSDSDVPPSFPTEQRTLRGFPSVDVKAAAPSVNLLAPEPLPQSPTEAGHRAALISRRIVPLQDSGVAAASADARHEAPVENDGESEPRPATMGPTSDHGPHSTSNATDASPGSASKLPASNSLVETALAREAPTDAPPGFGDEMSPASSWASVVATTEDSAPSNHGPSTNQTLLSRRDPVAGTESNDDAQLTTVTPEETGTEKGSPKQRRSYSELVSEMLDGNDQAYELLLKGGETAVGALIASFPGPVKDPESATTLASECGPILRALAAIGSKAIPFLTVRTADEVPNVRRWATFLLGELPGKESAKAIASRLLDDAVEVRRAALSSARRIRKDVLARRTLRAFVEQIARDASLPEQQRSAAIEALADIREDEAVPTLLQLLEDTSQSIRRASRWALCVLTRQDFGSEPTPWRQFWQEHRDEDRVEWLITSLDHDDRDIRRAAADELCGMAGESFGFEDEQTAAERRLAQAGFRTWWKDRGKASR